MICSRLCQNTSVIHGIFRRLSLNGDNLRITSFPDNFTNITPAGKKLLGQENSLVCSKHARLITLGNQLNTKNLREMSTSKASTSSGNTNIKTNRLALEKSPYLLQHATNPVDWYPWGREAFETAQKENKLIFLSVGYSTCHWCHVMEKESFENDSVALIMNQHFINIKVDREERPDVDKLYMSFIQATVGGGGWPMSVFLTPNLEPLAGGTYFPPEDRYGRPGFKSVLKNIADMWKNKQGAVESSGKTLYLTRAESFFTALDGMTELRFASFVQLPSRAVKYNFPHLLGKTLYLTRAESFFTALDGMTELRFASFVQLPSRAVKYNFPHLLGKYSLEVLKKVNLGEKAITEQIKVPNENVWKKCLQQLSRSYDDDFGGFSSAPKFPQPTNFNFLFHMYSRDKHSDQGLKCLHMCLTTLKKMAYGGIYDHVNSGFARYSVDAKWHVPHFEKMLYDQGQLVVSYCDAFVVTKDEFFSDVVHDILKYVSRDLSHELGGFYGAEDADSYPFEGAPHKKEGAFCVWDFTDLEDLLHDNNFDIFCHHYNVKPEGNVSANQDPHGELINKNILTCFGSYEETAQKFDKTTEEIKDILRKCHEILYARRQERPKPHVDTKIVTSWNGLMISGFAKAGFALKEQKYINRAILAANFIRKFLYNEEERSLLRCCYRGEKDRISQIPEPIQGFLDDYAFLIRGLLDLYEASLDADWLQWAEALQEQQDRRFWDATGSGYFTSPEGDESILIRGKEDQDGAEPCGNSVSVHNLLRLSAYLDRQDLRSKAGRTLTRFSERLQNIPVALPEMASALLLYHNSPTQVFIAGETGDNNTEALLDVVRSHFIPGRILALADGPSGRSGILYRRHESLSRLRPVAGKPAAYVCRNFACSLPVTDPVELADNLDSADKRPDDNPDLKKVFYESSSAADGSSSDTTDDGLNKS